MGKNRKLFVAVKRVFSPSSKDKKSHKSKHASDPICAPPPEISDSHPAVPPPPMVAEQEVELDKSGNVHGQENSSIENATDATGEASAAAAMVAAPEVIVHPVAARFAGKSKEEIAAIKIQSAFRGYMARRALRALKGLVRLKTLMHGNSVKRQSASTLRCMQTLSRVQSQIRSRRVSMTEENQALQRQLQLKRERELEGLKASLGEDWDDSLQSREQIEANLVNKHEASIKRERALAYAYSHQWKSSRSINPMFMDPNNPSWGWSWVERWMASRPWESRTKEAAGENASVKSSGGEILKAYTHRDGHVEKTPHADHKAGRALGRPVSRQLPATPTSKVAPFAGRAMPPPSPSPKSGGGGGGGGGVGHWVPSEDDTRSVTSIRSERNRRHVIKDDESLASSPAVPSYMTPTESAKAKSRLQAAASDAVETPERVPPTPTKKRLSLPAAEKLGIPSPARGRRLSGPPRVSTSLTTVGNAAGS